MAGPASYRSAALALGEEAAEALGRGAGVVALETTLVTHGVPAGRGVEVARAVEDAVRRAGAVPATVGVVEGRPTVGLTGAEVERLVAMAAEGRVAKASSRDLPAVVAAGASAATTVAATAWLAHRVGVEVFATGGLGGVHRGARDTWDESADLAALATTPVTVLCSGVKSILDVPATLERLETLGVPVAGYRTRRLAGFLGRDAGLALDRSLDTPAEVAAAARARDALGLPAALVVANPVPEADALDPAVHDRLLDEGLAALTGAGVTGKDVTPFLLDHLHRSSGGATVRANVALVRSNAALAGEVAAVLAADARPEPSW